MGVDGAVESVDQGTESTITTLANSVSPSTVMGAVMDFAHGREVNATTISHAASEMGLEPSQVQAMVGQIRGAFETQARAVVDKTGLSSDEVFNWAYENRPDLMREAIRHQATQRNTSGYQKVAQAYLENLDAINPDALLNAQLGDGLEIKKGLNGKLVLKTPMGEMEYRSAVKAGVIKISKAQVGGRR